MASGLPVVATRNVGARYLTDRGRAGVLVDPPDLGPTLLRLLCRRDARSQLAIRGLQRSEVFELRGVADRYERIYRRTLARRQRGSR
jgi:glycosyltransferase involved in cell wall biosynthesis